MGRSIWEEMYLILEQMTSSTGCGGGEERERERSVRGCRAKKQNKTNVSFSLSYPVLSSDQVRLVHDEEADVLDVLPLLPAAGQDVPFVRGADDDVALAEQLQVGARLSCQQHHLLAQDVLELLVPVNVHLRDGEFKITNETRHRKVQQTKHILKKTPVRSLWMSLYLLSQCFHGGDVDAAALGVVQQHPQDCKLGTDCLSTSCWSSHKHTVVAVVDGVED